MDELMHKDLTEKIIKCFYEVYNKLGFGFLERVYANAMVIELGKNGIQCEVEKDIRVYYDNCIVGLYSADMIAEKLVIVELKACGVLKEDHENQLINYLKATEIEVGLLLNFGKKPEFKRKIFTNN